MKAFISYSHHDLELLSKLRAHLSVLRRDKIIDDWIDKKMLPGHLLNDEIHSNLVDADLFVALVSSDFLNSAYIMEKEVNLALNRHRRERMPVVAVVARPCDWQHTDLAQFVVTPTDGKPITTWENEDEAFLDVVAQIRRLLAHRASRLSGDGHIRGPKGHGHRGDTAMLPAAHSGQTRSRFTSLFRGDSLNEQISCKFINGPVPDIHRLRPAADQAATPISTREQATLERGGFAKATQPNSRIAPEALRFFFLRFSKNQTAPEFLKTLLLEKIDCPSEGLYEVFGRDDVVVELAGSAALLEESSGILIDSLQDAGYLSDMRDVRQLDVEEVYRHWSVDADAIPISQMHSESVFWIENPMQYRSLKAFVWVSGRKFGNLKKRRQFIDDIRRELQKFPIDERLSVYGWDLVERAYYCGSQGWLLGLSCRCGDYYRLNDVANSLAGVVEGSKYKTRKTTHLVSAILHFAPWQTPIIDSSC